MIKETFDSNKTFSFDLVSSDIILKEILSLDIYTHTHTHTYTHTHTHTHTKEVKKEQF